MNKLSSTSGFTLVELLITISISAILLSAATPAFNQIYQKNKLLSYSNNLRTALYRAQNEAIKRNRTITVQPNTANSQFWEDGWNVYLDADNDNIVDNDEIIATYTLNSSNYTIKSSTTAFGAAVSFNAFGLPEGSSGSSNGSFWICRPDNDATLSSTVTIAFSGFISITKGATCS